MLGMVLLTACSTSSTYTASMLKVVQKGYIGEDDLYWIQAYDPNNQPENEAFKITVKERMAWNLIEENVEYVAEYTRKNDSPWELTNIEPAHIPEEN